MNILGNVVFPVVVAIIITMVVTPLGDVVKDLLFPPRFTIEGVVKKSENPVPFVRIEVYKGAYENTTKFNDDTNPRGRFIVEHVQPEGTYDYRILNKTDNSILFGDELALSRITLDENLGDIDISRIVTEKSPKPQEGQAVNETINETALNPEFERAEKQADYQVDLMYEELPSSIDPDFRNITVWAGASPHTSSLIDRVTYFLHPTFEPSIVTRYSRADNFDFSFDAWGQFTLAAKVHFRDSQVKDLIGNIVFH
jgi:YEATS family